jgi:hypothetical protein
MISAVALAVSANHARAQFGGRQRDRTEPRARMQGEQSGRSPAVQVTDPMIAIERELPSLRADLGLSADQTALFDSFAREVRDAADAGRMRPRHLSALRGDDGNAVMKAANVLGTIADDDAQRADATHQALEKMKALLAALTPEQQRQFDRRIIQSLREPLGNS